MGVKIADLLHAEPISLTSLEGTVIAIDTPNFLFSTLNFTAKNTDSLFIDRTQRVINHLYGILYKILFLYSKRILPVFCFDGKVSELKRIITKDQLNDFRYAKRMHEKALKNKDWKTARQIGLSKEFLWPSVVEESKILLSLLGVPYIESPSSAEAQCAHLVKSHLVDYMNSQDFDSLLFGSPHVIQNLTKSMRRKIKNKWVYQKIEPKLYDLKKSLKLMGINYFQLIDLVLLLKTDYFPGIKHVGSKTALKLIKAHETLENIIDRERNKNYYFSSLTPEIIFKVRNIFLFPEVITPKEPFTWTAPIREKVRAFLCKDHHLNQARVENNLNKLINKYHSCISAFETFRKKSKHVQLTLDEIFSNKSI